MSDRVKVRIVLTEEVRYSKTVEMYHEDFEDLSDRLESGEDAAKEVIRDYLSHQDIVDGYINDVDAFYIVEEL